jgi:hypothetical protein
MGYAPFSAFLVDRRGGCATHGSAGGESRRVWHGLPVRIASAIASNSTITVFHEELFAQPPIVSHHTIRSFLDPIADWA